MNATTPAQIDATVREFCTEISDESAPVYVNLDTSTAYPVSECCYNVPTHVEKNGGEIVDGWMIWYLPQKFIEAEFHRVWRNSDGELVDVTPKPNGEQRVLFVPDSKIEWKKKRIPNIRKALDNDPLIALMIQRAKSHDELDAKYTDENGRPRVPALEHRAVEQQFAAAVQRLQQTGYRLDTAQSNRKIGRNDPCPCGSGKKYKKCHGSPNRKMTR